MTNEFILLKERPSFTEVLQHYIPLDKSMIPIKTGAKGISFSLLLVTTAYKSQVFTTFYYSPSLSLEHENSIIKNGLMVEFRDGQ